MSLPVKKTAYVLLIDGFEEIEAVAPIDVLRRGGLEVKVLGVETLEVASSRKMVLRADALLKDVELLPDVLVIPGGAPGAENMGRSQKVREWVEAMDSKKKLIAAICASPAAVLAPGGYLKNRSATCFPGCEAYFDKDVRFSAERVVLDGHILTSRAAGTAIEFSLKIVEVLIGPETSEKIAKAMLC